MRTTDTRWARPPGRGADENATAGLAGGAVRIRALSLAGPSARSCSLFAAKPCSACSRSRPPPTAAWRPTARPAAPSTGGARPIARSRSAKSRPLGVDVGGVHFGSYSLVVAPTGDAFAALARREARRRLVSLDPNVRLNVEPDLDVWGAHAARRRSAAPPRAPRAGVTALSPVGALPAARRCRRRRSAGRRRR
jgi:hypothetical protein